MKWTADTGNANGVAKLGWADDLISGLPIVVYVILRHVVQPHVELEFHFPQVPAGVTE